MQCDTSDSATTAHSPPEGCIPAEQHAGAGRRNNQPRQPLDSFVHGDIEVRIT